MILRRYQWVLGIVWLAVAGVVAFVPEWVSGRIRPGNEWLIVTTAVVFAIWNSTRWYAFVNRRGTAYQSPFRRHHDDESGGKPSTSTA